MPYVQETGTGSLSATGASFAVTVTNAPAAGSRLIARIAYGGAGITISTIVDSKGNNWAVDKTATASSNYKAAICSTPQDIGQLAASDTITFNLSSTARAAAIVDEFSGVLAAGALDKTATTTATTTSRDGGTTAATSQDDELVVACFLLEAAETGSLTPGGSYQSFTTPYVASVGGIGKSLEGIYAIVSATGAQHPTATGVTSANSLGVTATYRAAAAAAGGGSPNLMLLGVG